MTKQQLIKNGMKYQFKNEVQDDKHVLTLSGVVAKPDWLDRLFETETINAEDIAEALDDVDKDILIRLNSGGGDVFVGIEIYNYLKNHPSHITIEITALAASAASIIAQAADELIMDTGSSLMIHQASTFAWGDKTELKKTLNALETIDGSLVDIYNERTGIDTAELDELLTGETWFTADEAVEKGFADRKSSRQAQQTVETPEEEPSVPEEATNEKVLNLLKQQTEKMTAMTNEISALKQNNPQNQEPKRRLYF
ncbi:head maturation protease, ClpP-related [Salinicoccus halodurans]|uniref:ATP-dependent Clp protease proteolytic subunit n=1 Tax=Salinicoccus halodurans TaxID=407035 RepID=A0A0F7D4K0_9STAP|nr:head maturation protease, ClpP-related [Salinicoccus halodurans]AKG74370.1 peptidase [Salinicoccus halodurans]SFK95057.1 ATP-dependent protease ClpP, protease subunit [Salinicoccus halodurans]